MGLAELLLLLFSHTLKRPNQINSYWAKGSEVAGTNDPDMQYDGEYLMASNYFAMRWTADLTTPDYAGTYYFKVYANDGKGFTMWDGNGSEIGTFRHWNGTSGTTNTDGGNNWGTNDGVTGAFTDISDIKYDIVAVDLEANTTYRIEMEFCEHKDTAQAQLYWQYNTTEAVATTALTSKSYDAYLIPADYFTIPEEYTCRRCGLHRQRGWRNRHSG